MSQRTPDETLDRVSGSLMNVYNTYQGQKDKAYSESVLTDPNATPMQQAIALAKLGNKELANEVYKGSVKQAELAAKQAGKESAKDVYRGGGFGGGQDQPRDRSWRDALQGRTPTIMPEERPDITSDQTGAAVEGSPTQPGFSPSAPNRAAANALRGPQQMQMPGGLGLTGNQYQQPPQINMGQGQQQTQDQSETTEQMRQRAGMMNIDQPGSGKALLAIAESRDKNARADLKAQRDTSKEQKKEHRAEISKAFSQYSDFGAMDKLEKDLEEAEDLILNKNVSFDTNMLGSAIAAIAEGKESTVADMFKTKDQQKLFSVLRSSLKPKTEGGSNPSTREVLLSMSAIPSYMKSKEANAYIVGNLLEDVKLNKIRSKIMNDLRKDPEITAPEFYESVHEQMKPYLEQSRENSKIRNGLLTATSQVADRSPSPGHLFMYDPKSGDMFEAPLEDRQILESQKFVVLPSKRAR